MMAQLRGGDRVERSLAQSLRFGCRGRLEGDGEFLCAQLHQGATGLVAFGATGFQIPV